MKIKNLRLEKHNDCVRAVATVSWEDCQQKERDIYFETIPEFSGDLVSNPNSFLIACILPAMYYGEKRIKIDEEICPILKEGLRTNMSWFHYWYGKKYTPVDIEAKKSLTYKTSQTPKGIGLFLSGGVDSLFSLRVNRLDFPVHHPASIRDCFIVHGFDIHHDENSPYNLQTFERALATSRKVAKDAQANLIPVYTNVRHLASNIDFWMHCFFAAALSSVAHAFAPRLSKITISSDGFVSDTVPWGSHPLIDPNYSSFDLQVQHGIFRKRLEKIKVIADWDTALQNLRVCTNNPEGLLNCGSCEKCIRTMTMILAAGKLHQTKAFPANDVSPELLSEVTIKDKKSYLSDYYYALVPALTEIGREDLARVLKNELGLKGDLKRFDRKYLNRNLTKAWGILRKFILRK